MDDLARWSSTLDWAAQPDDVRAATARVLRDSLVVMVAGGRLAESEARRRALPLSGGPATIAGTKTTTGVCDAAWLNGCSLVALELDEGNKEIRGHATAHVLPAALAVAEAGHRSGPEFTAAFLAGHEVASRFGRATRLHAGVHPHGNWGVTGAAAAVAHLHHGDARATAAAIDAASALALATPFQLALDGLPVRDAWIGQANESGIRAWAAADATRGDTGVAALSLGHILGEFDAEALTVDGPLAITGGYLKRHASCSYTHPPADAALAVRERRGLTGGADGAVRERRGPEAGVDEIVIETHHLAAALDTQIWPSRLAAMFSVPYVVATALREGACPPEAFDEAHRADPALKALAAKVRVVHDPALDARLPKERVARLRVRWTDGVEDTVEMPNPVGDVDHEPLSEADLTAKAVLLLGEKEAHRVRDLADALIDASDVADVMAALREES